MNRQRELHLDQAARYTVAVQGRLGEQWTNLAAPMALTVAVDLAGAAVSTLTGPLADQAALQGLLRALYGAGFPLLLVRYDAPADPQGG